VSTQNIVIAVLFLLVGWVLHMMWDRLVDWMYDATGFASSIMWDVLAIIGILTVCVGVGFVVVHHHTTGT
jgi:hypothetical protein